MRKAILMLAIMLSCSATQADVIKCSNLLIKELFVEGSRDDGFGFGFGFGFENKLIVRFRYEDGTIATCGNYEYVYLENTHAAFNGVLSSLLAANMSGKHITIAVNTSKEAISGTSSTNANQISYVGFEN